jgi:hypothetical protein
VVGLVQDVDLALLGHILQGTFQEEVLENWTVPCPTAHRLVPEYAVETESWRTVIAASSAYRPESVGEGSFLGLMEGVL